jgi:hypothetical protein
VVAPTTWTHKYHVLLGSSFTVWRYQFFLQAVRDIMCFIEPHTCHLSPPTQNNPDQKPNWPTHLHFLVPQDGILPATVGDEDVIVQAVGETLSQLVQIS